MIDGVGSGAPSEGITGCCTMNVNVPRGNEFYNGRPPLCVRFRTNILRVTSKLLLGLGFAFCCDSAHASLLPCVKDGSDHPQDPDGQEFDHLDAARQKAIEAARNLRTPGGVDDPARSSGTRGL